MSSLHPREFPAAPALSILPGVFCSLPAHASSFSWQCGLGIVKSSRCRGITADLHCSCSLRGRFQKQWCWCHTTRPPTTVSGSCHGDLSPMWPLGYTTVVSCVFWIVSCGLWTACPSPPLRVRSRCYVDSGAPFPHIQTVSRSLCALCTYNPAPCHWCLPGVQWREAACSSRMWNPLPPTHS